MRTLPKIMFLLLLPAMATVGVVDLVGSGGVVNRHWCIDAGWTLSAVLAAGWCANTARRLGGNERIVWCFFTAGCASWLLGQGAWDYYELFSRMPASPTLADFGYLGLVPAYITGFVFMATGGKISRLLLILDEWILACAFLVIAAGVLWSDIIHTGLSVSATFTSLAYPVLYGVLACSLLLVPTRRFWKDRSLVLLFAGVFCQVVPFMLWTPELLRGSYQEGSVLDLVWMAGMLALAASACTYRQPPVAESGTQLFGLVAYVPLASSLVAVILWLEDFSATGAKPEMRALLASTLVAIVLLTACRLALTLRRSRNLFVQAQTSAEALRKSEERFRTIFEWAPVGIEIADMEGRLVATNSALQAMLGYSEEELSNITFAAITHPDDIEREMELDEALVSGEIDHYHIEKRHLRKNGDIIWTRLTASEVRDVDRRSQFAIGMVEDITSRKEAEEALRESEERYRTMMETSPDAVISLDGAGRILSVNPAAECIFGISRERLVGRRITRLIPNIVSQLRQQGYALGDPDILEQKVMVGVELIGRRREGTPLPLEASFGVFIHRGKRHFTCFLRDITERRKHKEQLEYQAQHDGLTGLPNRTLLYDRLHQACALSKRQGTESALLLMDLDRFKEVNDTFGHPCGDLLLQFVATRLQEEVRDCDTVARLGGDEFALLLPGAGPDEAQRIAERVMDALGKPMQISGQSLHVDASIGIALFPAHSRRATELLRQADIAMYAAKRAGSRIATYEAREGAEAQRRTVLLSALRHGIEHNELRLYYQPKVDCRVDQIVGVEALVRWQHPVHGLIQPDEFIPLAEHSGLIKPLTAWVINEALRQLSIWRVQGFNRPIWVNFSARSLHDRELPGMVSQLLARWRIDAQWLGIEITESAVMVDPDRALGVIQSLDEMGCPIAIDDFGRGYSSLGYLPRLPVSELKIDRSFVAGMDSDRSAHTIVRATINLAHDLGLRVVAEGVEHQGARDMLGTMACDLIQGYYFTPPLPAERLEAWVRDHESTTAPLQTAG